MTVEDTLAIADLMTGWIHRDLAQWEQMRQLFHPDGTIEITWFDGLFTDFVSASARMGESDLRTKHVIANPTISFCGDKAIAETNAMIVGENVEHRVGCMTHNRFYDRIEKRDGSWKIVRRQSIYDMGMITFPTGPVDVDRDRLAAYPREYAALAYLLDISGFPVNRVFATKGSELERDMKRRGTEWLLS